MSVGGSFALLPPTAGKGFIHVTDNNTFVSRRDRRARKNSSAGTAGRTTAAVLASAGLVIGTGVAANADDAQADGRASSTLEVETTTLNVDRASVQAAAKVSAPAEVSFERPAFSSKSIPDPQPEPETETQAVAQEVAPPAVPAPQPEQNSEPAQNTGDNSGTNASGQSGASNGGGASSQSGASGQSGSSNGGGASGQSGASAQSGQSGSSNQSSSSSSSGQSAPSSSSGGRGGVVSAAYSTLGTPHVMGGTTPGRGIDCSGMIQYAYAQAGISVPRTTHGMASLPRVSSPAPGDIVLANGNSHGGIYVGNGQVISTTASAGVRVHGINDGWHNVTSIHRPG